MTSANETIPERDEIEMLLPWYATGKLDKADRARVEEWLAHEPAMMRQLGLIRAEQEQSIRSNEDIAFPRRLSVDSVMAHAGLAGTSRPGPLHAVLDAVRDFFQMPTPGAVRWAAAAAAVVIVAQAAVIGVVGTSPDTAGYQTASGEQRPISAGTFALVRFADGAALKDVTAVLASLDMAITDGPRAGGFYRVRLAAANLDDAARAARMAELGKRSDLVLFVTPSN